LITERVVLTAGHCVWKTLADTVRVAFGTLSNDLKKAGRKAQIYDVERIELQDAYQDFENNYNSDIALLILKKPVTINSIVKPACVPWRSDATLMESQRNGEFGLVAGKSSSLLHCYIKKNYVEYNQTASFSRITNSLSHRNQIVR